MLRKISNLTKIRKAVYLKGIGISTPSASLDILVPFSCSVPFSLGDVFSVSDLRSIIYE